MFHSCLVARYHDAKDPEVLGLGYQEAWIRPEKKDETRLRSTDYIFRTYSQMGRSGHPSGGGGAKGVSLE